MSREPLGFKMMMKSRTLIFTLIGVMVGVVSILAVFPAAITALSYFRPPRVTVMNATGEEISDVAVALGTARQQVPDMKDGHARTVLVQGRFSECSTHVTWTDSAGKHEASAGDYMENCGFYHATVVLTPDRKAKAIHEITDANHCSDGAPQPSKGVGNHRIENKPK